MCWPYYVPQGVFYLCEGEVYGDHTMHHNVCFTCVNERCMHVGYTVHHKVCFTCVKERCVLAIPCTTRFVLPV